MTALPRRARGGSTYVRVVGLWLLAYTLFDLRPFLGSGLPLFFDAHSHLTRSWLAARALEAGSFPTWTFEWYGGYRLFQFYSPAYFLLTGGLGILGGDLVLATKLVLHAGQVLAVGAFYVFLIRLGASPLSALFGALLYLHDAERWRVLAVIGNYPTVILYAVAPLVLLSVLRADGTTRSSLRLFAALSLLLTAMLLGHLTNAAWMLPALLAFAVASFGQRLERAAAVRASVALAMSLVAVAATTAFLTVPMLRDRELVSLSLEGSGIAWDPALATMALGFTRGTMKRIFIATPGAFWCALALGAGLFSLRARHAGWRPCFAGLCACLLSLAVLGERSVLALILFVAPLCAAALEIVSRAVSERGGKRAAVAIPALAVAAVLLWHHTRDRAPLRYVDAASLAIYERIPKPGGFGRSFDLTPVTDSVDGVYGTSSFSPYWTSRSIPFGAFPQGAPLAVNVQMALVGKLVGELAKRQPELSADALDLLHLLHVEWLVDRDEPPRLARLTLDARAAELREPDLLRLRDASPALFARRLERIPGISGERVAWLRARLEAQWARDPLDLRGQRSLDAISRTGARKDWPEFLPLLRGMEIERAASRARRFFVDRFPAPSAGAEAGPVDFAVLAHREQRLAVEVVARSSAPGFVRLAYGFDPELGIEVDGEPTPTAADFLGAVVLPFPAGTHTITLAAPSPTPRLRLLWISGTIAAALAVLWIACRHLRTVSGPISPTRRAGT